jgi:CPA2 family monovalent cation:H+ antiporter-2
LGAFLSGLIISESEYNYHTLGNILPFQEIFTCFFFISTGMLLDGQFVLQYPFLILGCVIAIASLKATAAAVAARLMGYPLTTAIITGLNLCQVGEFSFLLVKSGVTHNISTPFHYQLFLAMTLFSMALTPLMVHLAPRVTRRLQYYGWLPSEATPESLEKDEKELMSHVIIAGFGTSGQNLASALKGINVPYVAIEIDPQIVHNELIKGEPIIFGDASNSQLLEYAKIQKARIITVVTNDERRTRRIITIARRANPHVYIIARTRSTSDIKRLRNLGANEVIPEELEASIEVFSRVMRKCLVPKNEIANAVHQLRSSEYEILRESFFPPMEFADLNLDLSNMEIASCRITSNSSLVGSSLKEIDFRKKYAVTVLAISRFGNVNWTVDPELELTTDDILILFGLHNKIEEVKSYFNSS